MQGVSGVSSDGSPEPVASASTAKASAAAAVTTITTSTPIPTTSIPTAATATTAVATLASAQTEAAAVASSAVASCSSVAARPSHLGGSSTSAAEAAARGSAYSWRHCALRILSSFQLVDL